MNYKHVVIAMTALSLSAASVSLRADEAAQAQTQTPPLELKHETRIETIAVSPDGKTLASVTIERKADKGANILHLWNLEDGQPGKSWEVVDSDIKALAFSRDAKILAIGGKGGITLWSVDGQQKKVLMGHTGSVGSLAFSPDGKTLASGSIKQLDGKQTSEIFLWDIQTFTKRELPITVPERTSFMAIMPALGFSADGTQIAAPQSHFVVGVWDTATLQLKRSVGDQTVRGVVTAVALSPDGKVVATGHMGHNLRLWSVQTGQQQAALLNLKANWDGRGSSGVVTGLAFQADGKTLISAGSNEKGAGGEAELFVWNWPDGQVQRSLIAPENDAIKLFDASSDGQIMATGTSLDPIIKVWRIR